MGRRCWLPLLVSWDPARNRKTLSWRILTVSERSRAVTAGSGIRRPSELGTRRNLCHLSQPRTTGPRAFLGYQTSARFLIGQFTTDGDFKPIFTVE